MAVTPAETVQRESSRAGKPPYHIEALARGLAVLSTFNADDHELGLTQIAQRVGMTKSTTERFVHTLRDLGYLEQDPRTKRYRPGVRVLDLGFAALSSMSLQQIALPHLERLHGATGESSSLAVLDVRPEWEMPPHGPEVVYIARIKARQILSIDLQVGSRLPAYCTGMGKVLLAHLPPAELDRLLARMELAPRGPNTITDPEQLRADLERIRAPGYAINDEELAAGLRTVAAPVRNREGRVVAAINVSVPAPRVSVEELGRTIAPLVLKAADQISIALGYGASIPGSASAYR